MLRSEQELSAAYEHCLNIARNHYENFPVASFFLGKQLRKPVAAVYAFARSADDFADEGELTPQQRLKLLDNFLFELSNIEQCIASDSLIDQDSDNPVFIALADVIKNHQIPVPLFYDLLSAFKQDVSTTRYQSFPEVLDYCRLSANPVGRILLYLNNSADDVNLAYSDAICTGLQLINFYQDIAQDMDENNRLYIPLDEMQAYGVTIDDIRGKNNNNRTRALMTLQLQRARSLYFSGEPLYRNLSGRFALEIHSIFLAGSMVLDKLENNVSAIYLRPRLTTTDKLKIIWKGLFS